MHWELRWWDKEDKAVKEWRRSREELKKKKKCKGKKPEFPKECLFNTYCTSWNQADTESVNQSERFSLLSFKALAVSRPTSVRNVCSLQSHSVWSTFSTGEVEGHELSQTTHADHIRPSASESLTAVTAETNQLKFNGRKSRKANFYLRHRYSKSETCATWHESKSWKLYMKSNLQHKILNGHLKLRNIGTEFWNFISGKS